jgi:hypothetical protein
MARSGAGLGPRTNGSGYGRPKNIPNMAYMVTTGTYLVPVISKYCMQCCGTGTGTVGTVTFCLVEPEPELVKMLEPEPEP